MSIRTSRLMRVVAGLGLAAALAVGAVMPALAADATLDGTASLTGGDLTVVTGGEVTFTGNLTGSSTTLPSAGNPSVTITDATGTGAGWTLSASADPFTNTENAHTLPADALTMLASNVSAVAGSTAGLPATTQEVGLTGTPSVVLTADPDTGMGTFQIEPAFTLDIPANAYAGTYTSTVTFTLAATP